MITKKTAELILDKDQFGGTNGRKLIDTETGKVLKIGVLAQPLREYAKRIGYQLVERSLNKN
jgi:hypothetical protein